MNKHIVFDCDGTLVDTSQLKYVLYPGINELLLGLSTDCHLYVWTARDKKSTLRILKELGVLQYFTSVCTIDDALPKPNPHGLEELLGKGQTHKACVIGDTSNDILGAKNFGVPSIGATWNTSANAEILRLSGAEFVTSSPLSCLEWINNNL